MPIAFHAQSQTFHLFNPFVSYIFKILPSGHLGQLYYGKALRDRPDFDRLFETAPRSMSVCYFEDDSAYSLEHIKQEYASYGTGDMHLPALDVCAPDGSRLLDLQYQDHCIVPGKPSIEGLPSTYTEQAGEATTLTVTLADSLAGVTVTLFYTIFEQLPAIARHAEIRYTGPDTLRIKRAMSLCLDLPDCNYEMLELTGAWARERHVTTRPLVEGVQAVYSLRGCSSHHFNPFLALKRPDCGESAGEVYGFSLVYSGNFLAQADVDPYHVTRITMGIHPQNFSWILKTGEMFPTPETVMVYSDQGLNGMSQAYHQLYRTRLARGYWRDRVRPVLLNNWEATYFDFDEDKLLTLAAKAKELGIELFVLDDGWFTHRSNDFAGLGDWEVDTAKLPDGLRGFGEKLNAMGLQFGLWIEPEMVNPGTQMWNEHPDWVLHQRGRRPQPSRHQYVLDYSNPEVVDHLYHHFEKLLGNVPVSYIKWDMNRSISDAFSCVSAPCRQGEVLHRYILGVYRLYQLLTDRFPQILFESCASGGARFDPGMLYYAPQCWTSDDTDAVERLKIQYGTSFVYPVSSMGAHVAAVPNHQLGRITSMNTRANVAFFGAFGYELDLTQLSPCDQEQVARHIEFFKQHRQLLQFGTFWRLQSPFTHNEAAWMTVAPDRSTALVGDYLILQQVNAGYRRIRLAGLAPDRLYRVTPLASGAEPCGHSYTAGGDELMQAGIVTTGDDQMQHDGDFVSRLYWLEAVTE
ncbi:MAG: alpha-galactosidase [Blautia massiliensis (ex Durand et al. 2017)]